MTGEQIRAARQARGWSQRKLAEMVNVSTWSVNSWEGGKNTPDKNNQKKLKAVLGSGSSTVLDRKHASVPVKPGSEEEKKKKIENMTSLKEVQGYMCPKNMFKSIAMCLECDGVTTCKAGQKAMALQEIEDKKEREKEDSTAKQELHTITEEEFDAILMFPEPAQYLIEQYGLREDEALLCLTDNQRKYSRVVWKNANVHDDPIDWYMNVFKVTRHDAQNRIYNYRKKYKNAPADSKQKATASQKPSVDQDARKATVNKKDDDSDEVSVLDFLQEQDEKKENKPKSAEPELKSNEDNNSDEVSVLDFLKEQDNSKTENETVTDKTDKQTNIKEDLEELVLKCLRENPKMKREELGKRVGKSQRTLTRVLNSLKEKGLLTRKGPNTDVCWIVNDKRQEKEAAPAVASKEETKEPATISAKTNDVDSKESFSYNQLMTIIGTLTRDPEIRTTQTGKTVCNFTVAVSYYRHTRQAGRSYKSIKSTAYYRVTVWGIDAVMCGKYLVNGRRVRVNGALTNVSIARDANGKLMYRKDSSGKPTEEQLINLDITAVGKIDFLSSDTSVKEEPIEEQSVVAAEENLEHADKNSETLEEKLQRVIAKKEELQKQIDECRRQLSEWEEKEKKLLDIKKIVQNNLL